MSKQEIILGIDLGTTTSEACIYSNNKDRMIKNEDGKDIIPSVIALSPSSKKIIVGEEADNIAEGNPKNVITEVKRDMGKDIELSLGNNKMSPEEVCAEILKYIKKYSEDSLGEEIKKAVITVPANFDGNQREATLKAGEIAGLNVLRIINEPTAAALAYCMENTDKDKFVKVMVYDLGGGTFDVTIGDFNNGVLEVLGGSGDNELGGKDFDRLIYNFMCEEFLKEYGIDLKEDEMLVHKIMKAAEKAKKSLSTRKNVDVAIPFLTAKDGKPLGIDTLLTRELFEGLISEKLDGTRKAIKKALKNAKLKKEDIDMVLLVGGSTRIPMVKELVIDEMGQEPKFDIDPDRAVATGAAIQGAIIGEDPSVDAVIMERNYLALGTATVQNINGHWVDGYFHEIIPENTPHLKEHSDTFSTLSDNQERVKIEVYEKANNSDSFFVADHTKLSEYRLEGIPPKPAGEETITLTYCYNTNGILDVKAVIDSTGKEAKFEVVVGQKSVKKENDETNLDLWEGSEIAGDHRSTIKIAEKRLKEIGGNAELEQKLDELKIAVIEGDKERAKTIDDELNDLIFDLDD